MQKEVEKLIKNFLKTKNELDIDIVNVMDIKGIAPSNPAEPPEPTAAKSTTSKVLLAENEIRKQSINVLRDMIKGLKKEDIRHTIAFNTSNKKISFKKKVTFWYLMRKKKSKLLLWCHQEQQQHQGAFSKGWQQQHHNSMHNHS